MQEGAKHSSLPFAFDKDAEAKTLGDCDEREWEPFNGANTGRIFSLLFHAASRCSPRCRVRGSGPCRLETAKDSSPISRQFSALRLKTLERFGMIPPIARPIYPH